MSGNPGKVSLLGVTLVAVACVAAIVVACSSATNPSPQASRERPGLPPEPAYAVNIPPMVPHSFRNEGDRLAELVVVFPTNVWEYDVLDYFPFKNLAARAGGEGRITE